MFFAAKRLMQDTCVSADVAYNYGMNILGISAFYFLLLTPLGLLFRLIGRDPLCRKFDSDVKSYWLTHKSPKNLDSYFHQF